MALCSSLFTIMFARHITIPKQSHWLKNFAYLLSTRKLQKTIVKIIFIWVLFSIVLTLCPLLVVELTGTNKWVWVPTTLNGILVTGLSVWVHGYLHKRKISESKAIYIGYGLFLFSLACISFGYINNVLFLILVLLFTLAEIVAMPACSALLTNEIPPDKRIATFALYALGIGIGESVGSAIAIGYFSYLVA